MLLGIFLILVSAIAYNGSVVLLAAVARRQAKGPALAVAVGRRWRGMVAVALNMFGWGLEIAALRLIPLTLARVLSVAGLGILLGLARWTLREPLGLREVLGAAVIALGITAVGIVPPRFGAGSPTLLQWGALLALLGPAVLLPYGLRVFQRPVSPIVEAFAAGVAYALSGIFTKGAADLLSGGVGVALLLTTAAMLITGLFGFLIELDALHHGHAAVVVPIVLALHTVVPIVCAPFFFAEMWPAALLSRTVLGAGILLTLIGTVILSRSPGLVQTEAEAELVL